LVTKNISIAPLVLTLVLSIASCRVGLTNRATPPLIAAVETGAGPSAQTEVVSPTTGSPSSAEAAGATAATVEVAYQTVVGRSPAGYGVNGWWTDQDAEVWQARYRELSPAVVRLPAPQSMLEPQNDDPDPSHVNRRGFLFDQPVPWFGRTITLGRWLAALRDQDATVMIHVPYLAGWLSANGDRELFSTYPPRDMAEYREYLLALLTFAVDEVGYPPERVILEPVNEPDLRCGQDANVPCFWENWEMDDLVAVMRTADEAAAEVDPAIRVVGVSECCATRLAETLVDQYDGQSFLDGFTYHRYVRGADFGDGLARGERLAALGSPVYLNEYGNTRYWSNGRPGALWHAAVLPQIWKAGINPIQFSMAEFPGSHQGYDQLGLFADWRNDWERKPAYWVYANFYRRFGGSELVSVRGTESLVLLAGRRADAPSLTIWLVNTDPDRPEGLRFQVTGFPTDSAQAQVFDNLGGSEPMVTLELRGTPLRFDFHLPAASSYSIVLNPSER